LKFAIENRPFYKHPVCMLYAPCHKNCPIFLLLQRQKTDSFCGREHTIEIAYATIKVKHSPTLFKSPFLKLLKVSHSIFETGLF
jgi:hypothetical protein